MTDLQTGSIRRFPVRYPRHAIAAGIESLRTRPLGRSNIDPRVISFGRSFGQDRPGGAHGAIDVFAGFGCLVLATVSGRVVEEWVTAGERRPGVGHRPWVPGQGNQGGHYVMIQDANGYHHYYAHMAYAPLVQVGDEVPEGTRLGYVGATGLSASHVQHLHYQVTLRAGVSRTLTRITNYGVLPNSLARPRRQGGS